MNQLSLVLPVPTGSIDLILKHYFNLFSSAYLRFTPTIHKSFSVITTPAQYIVRLFIRLEARGYRQ